MEVSYKILTSETGLKDLEKTVKEHLNKGWKPLGGIAFNHGYPYQAVGKVSSKKKLQEQPTKETNPAPRPLKNIASDDYYK